MRWRERLAAGLCKYCGRNPKPKRGAMCASCRTTEGRTHAARYARRQAERRRAGLPTAKTRATLALMFTRPTWTNMALAAARWPTACQDPTRHIARARGVTKGLVQLDQLGLVEVWARVRNGTKRGNRVWALTAKGQAMVVANGWHEDGRWRLR